MRALCWNGINDLAVENVPDPAIVNSHDAILRVTMSTACGSDLHLLDGYIPTMSAGDVIGHEFMGEIVEVGPAVERVGVGQRVVVPSFIGCGRCTYCQGDLWSLCDNTNPHPDLQLPEFGASTAGIYGYTQAFGGYAGSHAEYVRVPFADNDCFAVDGAPSSTASVTSSACSTMSRRAISTPPPWRHTACRCPTRCAVTRCSRPSRTAASAPCSRPRRRRGSRWSRPVQRRRA